MFPQVFAIFALISVTCNADRPLVKTPLGLVQGYYKKSFGGRKFSAFEGIPYAKPPIGDRRFEEAEPVEPWSGVWSANFLTDCAQTLMFPSNSATSLSQQNISQVSNFVGSEDCLYLNIYVSNETPKTGKNLEVIVHVHGGAYMYGSGHDYAKPEHFMDRDLILVTFNYRLGVLGFLSTEDDVVPGNNGLKDQVLVLKWVQDNIASFGGNPNSVTFYGLSAGGASVHLHYFSKLSKDLFHRGFAQSGSALNPWAIQEKPLVKTKQLAAALGCPTDCTKSLVNCLKQRPFTHLLDKIKIFFTLTILPCAPFSPVIEKAGSNPFLVDEPYFLLKQGKVHNIPLLVSMTSHEGILPAKFLMNYFDILETDWETLAPTLLEYNNTLDPSLWAITAKKIKQFYFENDRISQESYLKLVDLFSDRYFRADLETSVRMQAQAVTSPVYYFIFGYRGDNNTDNLTGHGAEVKYLFGPNMFMPEPMTTNEEKMKDFLLDLLLSYAKTNKPTFQNIDLKPIEGNKLTYLSINGIQPEENELRVVDELTTRAFWKSLKLNEGENLIFLNKDEL